MAFINPVLAEGVRLLARTTLLTDTSAILSSSPTQTPILTTSTVVHQTTAASPTTTETVVNGHPPSSGGGGGGNGGGSNNSSPLLFFVALGFGVVFTNLWIIVGVKYCFRYNARNRQMRMNEDGEPINMENMPRPHRRRREKKLMTIDEVNEKFPMQKYKTWVASRAQEGLPTRGGVSVPPSRANSVRDADGVAAEVSKERESTEDRPTTSATATVKTEKQSAQHVTKESTSSAAAAPPPRTSTDAQLAPIVSESATLSKDPNRASHDDDEDEDEHINAALPPECMGTSGDTCAICIDTLEDDDDVRGLTCGHAFHAVCLDPWLTSRRACCPLCKADYYTPKPRPPVQETGEVPSGVIAVTLPDSRRANMPPRPRGAFLGFRRQIRPTASQQVLAHQAVGGNQNLSSRQARRNERNEIFARWRANAGESLPPVPQQQTPPPQPSQPQSGSGGVFSSFRSAFPAFRTRRAPNEAASGGENSTVTPSSLEAGVRYN